MDILKTNQYVTNLVNVIKGNILANTRLFVNGRKKDGFVYILSGSCTYIFEDKTKFTAQAGNVIYLANNSVYKMQVGSSEYSFLYCDFNFFDGSKRSCALYKFNNSDLIKNYFEKLHRLFNDKNNGWHADCLSLFYTIYSQLLQTNDIGYMRKSWQDKIEWAQKFIKDNPNTTINEISKKLEISEVYFRKLFKSRFNVQPSQYIILCKVEQAKMLMEYPFLSIEECALKSGFSSVQYFHRIFKKTTGLTPSEYRKHNNLQ